MKFDTLHIQGRVFLPQRHAKTHKDKPEGTKTREDATKKHKDTENARYLAYNNFRLKLYKDTQLHVCFQSASTKTLQHHPRPDFVYKKLPERPIIDINHDLLTNFIKDVMSKVPRGMPRRKR